MQWTCYLASHSSPLTRHPLGRLVEAIVARGIQILSVGMFLFAAAPPVRAAAGGCLHYEPATAELTGVLRLHTFPGPPNYESVSAGDTAETGYYLHLSKPVCTVGAGESEALDDVRLVQLVLTDGGFKKLRPKVGRRVTVSGTLFAAVTGHHHAPLLLRVADPGEQKK